MLAVPSSPGAAHEQYYLACFFVPIVELDSRLRGNDVLPALVLPSPTLREYLKNGASYSLDHATWMALISIAKSGCPWFYLIAMRNSAK